MHNFIIIIVVFTLQLVCHCNIKRTCLNRQCVVERKTHKQALAVFEAYDFYTLAQ